ncbi:MAG: hypothetical protein C4291_07440 [Candidatus Dadabacteria bacterium]
MNRKGIKVNTRDYFIDSYLNPKGTDTETSPRDWHSPGSGGERITGIKRILRPAAWFFYLVVVCEILFMISPFALYFYSVYGPTLNFFNRSSITAWLTQFFLPHISRTTSPMLNSIHWLSGLLILTGIVLFLAGAIPIYWAKFRHKGAVTGGLYVIIPHPQYVGLGVLGSGTLLLWSRFIVLITYITMLFLYDILARWEEEQCLARFGESYRDYRARTGMYLPQSLSKRIPWILPASGGKRVLANFVIYAAVLVSTVIIAFGLRDYSLSKISVFYTNDATVLSPAPLTDQELRAAYNVAVADTRVREALRMARQKKLIVYVVPQDWYLVDLPMETVRNVPGYGHYEPMNFDRQHYKLLFARVRTYNAGVAGRDIIKDAYGRDPIVLVKVDTISARVTGIEIPPPHVYCGRHSYPYVLKRS